MKIPTFDGIFIFISKENVMLSWVEHEKKFYSLGALAFIVPRYYKPTLRKRRLTDQAIWIPHINQSSISLNKGLITRKDNIE